LTELFGNNTDNVFPPAGDSSVSDSGDVKDLKSAFERIYEAAKRGYVSDAFSCLLKLKKIPHYLCLSVFSEDAWGKIVPFLEAKDYSAICERVANLSAMYNPQKRQEFLSFLYAFYCANSGSNAEQFDLFDAQRINLGNQIKGYMTDQLAFQKALSIHTLHQLLFPTLGVLLVGFWGILTLAYYDDSAKRIGFGITGVVSGMLSAFLKWWLDQTKYFREQTAKWDLLTCESELQRVADLLAVFFTILGYQKQADEIFPGQNSINQAIQDQYGIILRLRQGFHVWPFHGPMGTVEPIEKLAIKYPRI
jgi:hypothetical protein